MALSFPSRLRFTQAQAQWVSGVTIVSIFRNFDGPLQGEFLSSLRLTIPQTLQVS
jgi:hypothetical protein